MKTLFVVAVLVFSTPAFSEESERVWFQFDSIGELTVTQGREEVVVSRHFSSSGLVFSALVDAQTKGAKIHVDSEKGLSVEMAPGE